MIDRIEQEVDQLERHIRILEIVLENEPIGIVKISDKAGEPHHKVRYSLSSLEEVGLIEPTGQGATTTNKIEEFVTTYNDRIDMIVNRLQGLGGGETDSRTSSTGSGQPRTSETEVYTHQNEPEKEVSETRVYEPDESN